MHLPIIAMTRGPNALTWRADRFAARASVLAGGRGASPFLVGHTMIAIGASAPEPASSVTAARKGETDLSVRTSPGSNPLTVPAVLGPMAPGALENAVLIRDYPEMVALTFLSFFPAPGLRKNPGTAQRGQGASLLAPFAGHPSQRPWAAPA